MTEKELSKLKRPDLLAQLMARGKEADELQRQLGETRKTLGEAVQLVQRLKDRLDEKDEQIARLAGRLDQKDEKIEHLKRRLDQKDEKIAALNTQLEELTSGRYLEMEGIRSLTDISERLGLMLRMAQKAADQYIQQVQEQAGQTAGEQEPDQPNG